MKDYGITFSLMAYCMIAFGILQAIRGFIFYVVIMNHQRVLGYMEVRYRRENPNARIKQETEVKFPVVVYSTENLNSNQESETQQESLLRSQTRHISKNTTCSICCSDFQAGESVVCLPCVVTQEQPERPPGIEQQLDTLKTEEDLETEIEPVGVIFAYMHTFHPPCIKEWLNRSNECPLCKVDVVELQVRK
jgi:hypothetical protein